MRNSCCIILFVFMATLFAERVSLNDATNVAINFYRENLVPLQIKKGLIDDYDESIKFEKVKFEIDSLVDEEEITIVYIFNFKPTGSMWVGASTYNDPVPTCSEEGYYSVKKFYENKEKKIPVNIFLGSFEALKKQRDINPSSEIIEKWKKYNINPNKFEVKKKPKNEGTGAKSPRKSQTFTKWHQN